MRMRLLVLAMTALLVFLVLPAVLSPGGSVAPERVAEEPAGPDLPALVVFRPPP